MFNQLGGSIARAKLAASILLSLPGVPYLYYGEEIGMVGEKPDENIRLPMQWDTTPNGGFTTGTPWRPLNANAMDFNVERMQADDNSLWNHYRNWIDLRKTNPALTEGRYKGLGASVNSIFAFLRHDNTADQIVMILHNLSSQNQTGFAVNSISSEIPSGVYTLVDIQNDTNLGSLTIQANGGFSTQDLNISIAPYAFIALKLQIQ